MKNHRLLHDKFFIAILSLAGGMAAGIAHAQDDAELLLGENDCAVTDFPFFEESRYYPVFATSGERAPVNFVGTSVGSVAVRSLCDATFIDEETGKEVGYTATSLASSTHYVTESAHMNMDCMCYDSEAERTQARREAVQQQADDAREDADCAAFDESYFSGTATSANRGENIALPNPGHDGFIDVRSVALASACRAVFVDSGTGKRIAAVKESDAFSLGPSLSGTLEMRCRCKD